MSDRTGTTCPNCGAVLPEGLTKCSNCGTPLAQPEESPVEYPPITPAPREAIALPPIEVPAGPSTTVRRSFSASVDFQIPQKAVDAEGWLTPGQWQRLLDSYEAALAARMKANMEQGLPSRPTTELGVSIPWEQVDDRLTVSQRREIERRLSALLNSVGQVDQQTITNLRQEFETRSVRPKATISCGVLVFLTGMLFAGVTAYLLAR